MYELYQWQVEMTSMHLEKPTVLEFLDSPSKNFDNN